MRKMADAVMMNWRKILFWVAVYLFAMFWLEGLVKALKLTPYLK